MLWVIIFVGIAVAGAVLLASYAVWLFHKVSDVASEVRVLAASGAQLAELAGQVQLPSDRVPQGRLSKTQPDYYTPGTLVDGDVG